jgi:D-sedoheptulose 7-phosphate isomerase
MDKKHIKDIIESSIEVKSQLLYDEKTIEEILRISSTITHAIRLGNRVFFAGNGGSAADAQHLAAEFVSKLDVDRPGLSATSLATDTSILTAIGNDYGYSLLFKRQLAAQGRRGDVFVGISTSGRSQNIIEAFSSCPSLGITSVALCGQHGIHGVDVNYQVRIPSEKTARIQECHILVGHIICKFVELEMFGGGDIKC